MAKWKQDEKNGEELARKAMEEAYNALEESEPQVVLPKADSYTPVGEPPVDESDLEDEVYDPFCFEEQDEMDESTSKWLVFRLYRIMFGTSTKQTRYLEWRELDYPRDEQAGDVPKTKYVSNENVERTLFHCKNLLKSYEDAGMARPTLWVVTLDCDAQVFERKLYDECTK